MLSIIGELFGSRMYNRLERKRELDEHSANFVVYIENIQKMFFQVVARLVCLLAIKCLVKLQLQTAD